MRTSATTDNFTHAVRTMADWTQKGKEPSGEARSHAPTQPIEAAAVPGSMLRIATVTAITGLSKRTIYRMMAGGEFPQSVHLSPRCTAWRQGDVAGWVTSLGVA